MTTTGSDERDILMLALAGTRHSGPATPQTTPQIDQLALAEDESEGGAERDVLLRAGAWGAYRRAGYLPLPAPEPPVPAPADARPACSPAASEAVATLLRGRRFDLLSEALARLRAAGLRLPADTLPLALSSVGMTSELRAALIPALGERGRWLARFNPAWAWASEPSDEAMDDPARAQEAWDTGTLRQRVAALRGMRRRDPAAARDLLTAEWKREKAEARATLLAALSVNLSLEDEPLLTQALSDRSEQVRGAATELLLRLPTSQLSLRTSRHAEATLVFTNRTLDVSQSRDDGDDALLDLLALASNRDSGIEGRRILLSLQYVIPEYWETVFAATCEELIAATAQSHWRREFLRAWTVATVRFGSRRWASALWDAWLNIPEEAHMKQGLGNTYAPLVPLLPDDKLYALALTIIADPSACYSLSLADILSLLPAPWIATVADAYSDRLQIHVATRAERTETPRSVANDPWLRSLYQAAIALPYSHFARAREACDMPGSPDDYKWHRLKQYVAEFTGSLYLRERIIREIPL